MWVVKLRPVYTMICAPNGRATPCRVTTHKVRMRKTSDVSKHCEYELLELWRKVMTSAIDVGPGGRWLAIASNSDQNCVNRPLLWWSLNTVTETTATWFRLGMLAPIYFNRAEESGAQRPTKNKLEHADLGRMFQRTNSTVVHPGVKKILGMLLEQLT